MNNIEFTALNECGHQVNQSDLLNAMFRNIDNQNIAISCFDWIDTLLHLAREETRQNRPNLEIIRHLVEISSHLAMTNDIHSNYKEDKAKFEAIFTR